MRHNTSQESLLRFQSELDAVAFREQGPRGKPGSLVSAGGALGNTKKILEVGDTRDTLTVWSLPSHSRVPARSGLSGHMLLKSEILDEEQLWNLAGNGVVGGFQRDLRRVVGSRG